MRDQPGCQLALHRDECGLLGALPSLPLAQRVSLPDVARGAEINPRPVAPTSDKNGPPDTLASRTDLLDYGITPGEGRLYPKGSLVTQLTVG